MTEEKKLLSCYNRGCGADYDPLDNKDDSCRHHPGVPYFHDAYKGWTCCNKKSVDFTEFLNIKGCEVSRHSNVKPAEPVKTTAAPADENQPPEPSEAATATAASTSAVPNAKQPLKPAPLKRSDFNGPLVPIVPVVAPALQQAIDSIVPIIVRDDSAQPIGDIKVGTVCKNGGCGQTYESPASNLTVCVHHPGVPIFHEGLKYWSCCKKRTSDFSAFLAQKGCENGQHKWLKSSDGQESIKCRYDWHQTGQTVVLAIYAKMYHYSSSFVKINPVRLCVSLVFPQQNDAEFNLDLELSGIIDVAATKVQFFGTKVEVTMVKAEPGHWTRFEVPRHQKATAAASAGAENVAEAAAVAAAAAPNAVDDDGIESDVDLDDVEAMQSVTITDQSADADLDFD